MTFLTLLNHNIELLLPSFGTTASGVVLASYGTAGTVCGRFVERAATRGRESDSDRVLLEHFILIPGTVTLLSSYRIGQITDIPTGAVVSSQRWKIDGSPLNRSGKSGIRFKRVNLIKEQYTNE